jgi:hypothetical protein
MHDCNFKEKRGNDCICSLCCVDNVLLLGQAYKKCVGEDNCIIFQIYDRLISLEADILMIKNKKECK